MSVLVVALVNALSWFWWKVGVRRAITFGRGLGLFVYYVLPVRRRVVRENLRRAYPDKSEVERRAIARGVYRQLGRVIMETLVMPRLTADEWRSLFRFEGVEAVDAVLAEGKGVIIALAHMGNWELLGYEAGRRGYRVHAITKLLKGAVNRALHDARRKAFNELPPSGSFEAALDVLAKGGVLAYIIDQHRGGPQAVVVDFFGRPASTSPAPALFAVRTGAPVFTVWVTIDPADDAYVGHVEGPFPVPDAPTLAERLQRHTQELATRLETAVRRNPEQWFWVHRRWKVDGAAKKG